MLPPLDDRVVSVVEDAGLAAREAQLWLIRDADGVVGLLRRGDPATLKPSSVAVEDRVWVHRVLEHLGGSGFPAPQLLPVLFGRVTLLFLAAVSGPVLVLL